MARRRAKGTVLKMVPSSVAPPAVPEEGSAEALLVDLLARVRAGFTPVALVVHCLHDPTEKGRGRHMYWSHGVTPLEHLGLLDVARFALLQEENS